LIEIAYLNDHEALIPRLAQLHSDEWSHLYLNWDATTAIAEFAVHQTNGSIPATLIALRSGELVGSVSLIYDDLAGWEYLNPWLASLYVLPEYRGQGIGSQLVTAADELLVGGMADAAFLFTETREAFFTKLGWKWFAASSVFGNPVTVMAKTF
jgi:predicted N-acetyltransferase YhbS